MTTLELMHKLTENDGVTLKKGKIVIYKTGWQVADHGMECSTAAEAAEAVENMNGTCGVWLEKGIYYVDHSFRVNTKKQALEIGRQHNQISVYGWKRGALAYC